MAWTGYSDVDRLIEVADIVARVCGPDSPQAIYAKNAAGTLLPTVVEINPTPQTIQTPPSC